MFSISSLLYFLRGRPQKALIKSIGIADNPIPPNSTNKNHDKNEMTPITYMGKETSISSSTFELLQSLAII